MTSVVVSELYFTDTNCEDGNSTFKAARDKKGEEKTHNDGEFWKYDNATRKLEAWSAVFRVSCDGTA